MLRSLSCLLLATFLTACIPSEKQPETPKSAEPTIGVVDTARIFRESVPGKNGVKFLEEIQAKMQNELTALQTAIQKEPENVELQQKAQSIYMQFQQSIGAEEQNVVNILNDLMTRTIEDYRVNKKLLIIVSKETTLSYDSSMDVSADIIAELNKHDVKFKSVAPEEPAQKPEEASAPAAVTPEAEGEKATEAAAPAASETPAAEEAKETPNETEKKAAQ